MRCLFDALQCFDHVDLCQGAVGELRHDEGEQKREAACVGVADWIDGYREVMEGIFST